MIRVLSDLHLAHPASLIGEMDQIEPLLEGARTMVFNGDTAELREKKFAARSRELLEMLRNRCAAHGAEAVFINGNHDPDISEVGHLDLMAGRVFVTHGHALFPAITPWGREAKSLRDHCAAALDKLAREGDGAGTIAMGERLRAVNEACRLVPSCRGAPPETGLQWVVAALKEMTCPTAALEVLRAWIGSPGLAADFVEEHRPRAECVIMGHTHFPGFWKRNGRLTINTGAYLPWLGRRVVEIFEGTVRVRAVVRDGKLFRPGRELFCWRPQVEERVAEPSPVAAGRLGTVE